MGDSERHRQIIEEIEGMKKKDDVCDTILQAIAYVGREVDKEMEVQRSQRRKEPVEQGTEQQAMCPQPMG